MLIAHRDKLTSIPIALFSVGMIDPKRSGKLMEEHNSWLDKAFTNENVNLTIVSNQVFDGAFRRRNLPFWLRIVDSVMRPIPQGDYRRWDEIEKWADEVAETFADLMDRDVEEDGADAD